MNQCKDCSIDVDVTGWSRVAVINSLYCWDCFQQRIISSGGVRRRCQHCATEFINQWASKRPADDNIFECDPCRRKTQRAHLYRSA